MQSTYRYERKFIWPFSNTFQLEQILWKHPALFSRAYPTRQVNSLYFDTPDIQLLQQNMLGDFNRVKVRLRWYGSSKNQKKVVLEIKHKQGELNEKKSLDIRLSKSLNTFLQTQDSVDELTHIVKKETKNSVSVSDFLQPTLLNEYQRSYFYSPQLQLRVTLDENILFDQFSPKREYKNRMPYSILEAKYLREQDLQLRSLISNLPLQIAKLSKYEVGMLGSWG